MAVQSAHMLLAQQIKDPDAPIKPSAGKQPAVWAEGHSRDAHQRAAGVDHQHERELCVQQQRERRHICACKLDAGAFGVCTSAGGQSYTGLAVGAHTFTVQATDLAGNTGTASYSWTITTTPPPVVPQNGILDSFNRANGGVGGSWDGLTGTTFYKVASNKLDVQTGGPLVWKPTLFGTSQEAYVTLSVIDTKSASQGVLLKV
jgi:hypothetical protein